MKSTSSPKSAKKPTKSRSESKSEPKSLETILRQALLDTGWNANQISRATGVPQPMVYRFLKGQRSIKIGTADRFCRLLGMTFTKPKKPRKHEK